LRLRSVPAQTGLICNLNFPISLLLEFPSLPKALKQVAKALPTTLHVAVGKEHVAKNLCHLPREKQSAKPLPPACMAVGKGNERRCR